MTSNDGSIINFGLIGWPFPYESHPPWSGTYPYYPAWNQTASSVGWIHPVVGKAKGLEFGIARTPFHDMYQQCPGNANREVLGGWDEVVEPNKKKVGERECGMIFFLSLFVADSRRIFAFEIAMELKEVEITKHQNHGFRIIQRWVFGAHTVWSFGGAHPVSPEKTNIA